jgi:redox-sensing transcriptional repressor
LSQTSSSEATLRRLSRYARCLHRAIIQGKETVTSEYLAGPCGTTPASVRKDLAAFGGFGKQGSGYDAILLLNSIEAVLGTNSPPPLILLGVGHIGRALLEGGIPGTHYMFAGAFDVDGRKVDCEVGGVRVSHLDELETVVEGLDEFITVLAVSRGCAQEAVDRVVDVGCRSILSFGLEPLEAPEGVSLRYADVPMELDLLTHELSQGQRDGVRTAGSDERSENARVERSLR